MSLTDELQRRKVFKVGAAYLVVAWLVVQAASIGFPAFDAPPWALRSFILVSFLGFPVALVMAWVFDASPEGVKLDPAGKGTMRVFAFATLLAVLALAWYFKGQPSYRAGDVPAASDMPSVAVLPFANLSGKADEDYFSDGMTEELLNVLAKVPKLKVAARTSVFEFKGKGGDVKDIGRKLGVGHIVEGSIRREGEHVRVTAQLIRVLDGFHVWSENYDREVKSVIALQDEIAKRIGEQLTASLGVGAPMAVRAQVDPGAYDEYLKGRALLRSRKDLPVAIAHFQAAVAKAPDFAAAWSSLSLAQEVSYWFLDPQEASSRANLIPDSAEAARHAAALEPNSGPTEHALGNMERAGFHYAEAERHYLRAMELDPSYPDVREDYAELLFSVGNMEPAARASRQLVTLDPYFAVGWIRVYNTAVALDRRAEVEESVAQMRAISATGHNAYNADPYVIDYALAYHRVDEAQAALADLERTSPEQGSTQRTLVTWALGLPGADAGAARAIIDQAEAASWFASAYYVARRDIDGYNAEMARASPIGQARYFVGMYESRPDGQAMLHDPRVKPLLEKYGFVAYWREKGFPNGCRALGGTDFECGI